MNLDKLVKAVHALANGDTDAPVEGDDDYKLYTELLNAAVNRWETEGVEWNVLWRQLQSADSGSKTVTSGTFGYDTPENFKQLGSFVRVYTDGRNIKYPVVSLQKVAQMSDSAKYAYITGNPVDNYKVNFNPVPTDTEDNLNIDYSYYSGATYLEKGTDVTECPDPYFLVHHAVSELKKSDEDSYGHSTSLREAENKLKVMRADNHKLPAYEPNQIDVLQDYGFGV